MKRVRKKKLPPLYKILEHHDRMCAIRTYHLKPEERHCSCGVEEARKVVERVRNILAAIENQIDNPSQIKEAIGLLSG